MAPPDTDTVRVRLLQTEPLLGQVAANLAALEEQIRTASACDLVVTPELATHGYDLGQMPDPQPIQLADPRLQALGQHGPAAVVGFAESGRRATYNSAALIGVDGSQQQRKLTLPTYAGWEEKKHFAPGARLRTHRMAGAQLATLICNDAWQPQFGWLAAQQGAEVLVVPTNSVVSDVGLPTDEAWDIQLRALAVALQCYVLFVNRVGSEPCGRFWGGTRGYGPDGASLGQLGSEPGHLDVVLDLAALRRLRRRWPLLRDTRADVMVRGAQELLDQEYDDV